MNKKNFLWILVGAGYGIMLEIVDVHDFLHFLGFSILAVVVGFVSRTRYLSFVTILSSVLTRITIQSLDYGFDVSQIPLLLIISGVYGINGPISAWAAEKVSKQRIVSKFFCPNCGRRIEKTHVCPYCGTNLVITQAYDDGTQAYDDGTQTY